jgi:hypothetical protein
MGLFGKKKNQDSANYENVMASMFAPQIPEIQDEWLLSNQVDFPAQSIFKNSKFTYADAWFNVEVAAMMVSTRIPTACDACDEKSTCKKCGKSEQNYTKIMTANADGDYLGWTLVSDEEFESRMLADGFFVSFDKSVESTYSKNDYLTFKSQKLAPVVIKDIDVKAYASDIGMIFVGDAFAHLDGKDFISGIKVPEGKYQVIAWMGYTMTGAIAPMACTILGENFVDKLDFSFAHISKVPANIKDAVIGSDSQDVLARFDADMGDLADRNASFYDLNDPGVGYIGASWGIQFLLHSDRSEFDAATKEALEDGPAGMLSAIDSLRIRGQQTVAMELIDLLEKKHGNNLHEVHQMMIRIFRKFPPGTFGVKE